MSFSVLGDRYRQCYAGHVDRRTAIPNVLIEDHLGVSAGLRLGSVIRSTSNRS